MYYLEAGYEKHHRMRNAVLLAAGLHLVFVLLVSFEASFERHNNPQIEVTLATRPSNTNPDEARHIAQASQEGSGEQADSEAVTSRNNRLPGNAPQPEQSALRQAQNLADNSPQVVDTVARAQHAVAESDQEKRQQPLEGINPELDDLNRQLAGLEAELDEQNRTFADRPRVKRLTSVATREAADAAYLHSFLQRLEAVGNKYYPEASIRYGLYGSLRLLVAVRKDGHLEEIKVLSTSGFAVLDEAAIKTVRMAAPFPPFPAELAATTDRLEIIRTWHFEQNELSSNQGSANRNPG